MKQYLIETHMHTSETSSCGKLPATEIVRLYKEHGYATLVITDHLHAPFLSGFANLSWKDKVIRYLTGYRTALAEGMKMGVSVILGMEIRFTEGPNDYLVYGFSEDFLFDNPNLHEVGIRRFREMTLSMGIRIFQAHPFRDAMERVEPALLDGIEVFNGNPRHNSRNSAARDYAKRHGLRMISGSDAHQVDDVGAGGIVSPRRVTTVEDLTDLLDRKEYVLLNEVNGQLGRKKHLPRHHGGS